VNVSELVGSALARLGAGHAFGVVGSGNFHVTNALRAAGVPFVAARHEVGAATMADAWARTTGRPAVLTVRAGNLVRDDGLQIQPVSRLDVLLYTASGGFVVGSGGVAAAPRAPSGTTLPPIFSPARSAGREKVSGRLSCPVRRPKTLRSRRIRNAATIANRIMSK